MTTLHDRLAHLAEDAPPGGPVPGLWERGRRYHRRRRAGTAVIAAAVVVLLAVIATIDWRESAPVPAPARGPVGLPDRMWTPSPWLPSTKTPGQLVAVASADRGSWTGTRSGLVGVSATSGEYAFLDLPDVDLEHSDVALAPDGRHLAYWLTGPTTGSPNSNSGPIAGLAVFDTATGEVRRHWISTPHGLMPDFLTWADAGTVVFSAGQIRGGDDDSDNDQALSSFGTVTAWRLGDDPAAIPGVEPGAYLEGAGHGWIVVDDARLAPDHRLLVNVADPSRSRSIDFPHVSGGVGSLHFASMDASGRRLAAVPGDRNPGRVHAGPLGRLQEVPRSGGTFGVVDWLDGGTIATLKRRGSWRSEQDSLARVSVATGESRELVRLSGRSRWSTFATGLLDAPSVAGVRPPTPLDPRVTAGSSVAILLAGVGALVLWRRRVRA